MSTCTFKLSQQSYFNKPAEQLQLFQANGQLVATVLPRLLAACPTVICGLPTVEGGQICSIHKCSVPTCYRQVDRQFDPSSLVGTLSKQCDKHTCHYGGIIGGTTCSSVCVTDSDFCTEHKCVECEQPIARPHTTYCFDHLTECKCAVHNCSVIVPCNKGYYCDIHRCEQCQRYQVVAGYIYCDQCLCQYPECSHHKSENDKFCSIHSQRICSYKQCKHLKVKGYDYCHYHMCSLINCRHHIHEYDDDDGYRSKFCREHDRVNSLATQYGFTLNSDVFKAVMAGDYSTCTDPLLKQVMLTLAEHV